MNFQGIVVYTIDRDGCLNGVYSNTGVDRDELYNEIARKNPNQPDGIEGTYTCSWIDANNKVVIVDLTILWHDKPNQKHYKVEWTKAGTVVYKGIGFKLGNNTFAVHYTAS